MEVVLSCETCRNYMENLSDGFHEALTELAADQQLDVLVGLCEGCK